VAETTAGRITEMHADKSQHTDLLKSKAKACLWVSPEIIILSFFVSSKLIGYYFTWEYQESFFVFFSFSGPQI